MDPATFLALALTCSPQVDASTASAIVQVESGFNPWAIGLVGGALVRQPATRAEAVTTARALHGSGWNFSVGLGQINVGNFQRLGLNLESGFDPCTNLAALQTVLTECMGRITALQAQSPASQAALRQALSCYYSGNFVTGFRHGYVRKVAVAARSTTGHAPHSSHPAPSKETP